MKNVLISLLAPALFLAADTATGGGGGKQPKAKKEKGPRKPRKATEFTEADRKALLDEGMANLAMPNSRIESNQIVVGDRDIVLIPWKRGFNAWSKNPFKVPGRNGAMHDATKKKDEEKYSAFVLTKNLASVFNPSAVKPS